MNPSLFQIYLCRAARFPQMLERLLFSEIRNFDAKVLSASKPLSATESPQGEYRPICEKEQWGKLWDSGYFQLRGEIPPEWCGKPVWMRMRLGGEILLYDSSYKPVGHLTDSSIQVQQFKKDLYPIAEAAEPGKFIFYAEVGANGFNATAEIPPGICQELQYGVFRKDIWDLLNDFRTVLSLLEIHQKPPYPIPGGYHWERSAATGPADRRAAQLCMVLNDAVSAFGLQHDCAAARKILAPELKRRAQSSVLSTTAVGHAHLDIGYLWKMHETQRKACRTFIGQLFNIRTYPGYVFGMSQPQVYEYVRERMPQVYEDVKKAVRAGSWELQGGMWVETDCVLPAGESLIRQFIHGKNFWREEFGEDVKNVWLPDAFGFAASLPQIMQQCGCRYFTSQKISWNEFNRFPFHSFRWRGFGGAEVLTHFIPEDNYNAFLEPAALHFAEDNFQENHLHGEFLTLFGAGDGGGGPKMEHIESGIRDADLEDVPHLSFGRACDFFERMESVASRLPVHEGEIYFELHRGTLTNQGRIKRFHRLMEQRLAAIEILLASAPAEAWPHDVLDRLWKEALLFEFHDIVTGTSILEVHEEVLDRYRAMEETLAELQKDFAGQCRRDAGSLTVFQTLNAPGKRLLRLPEAWAGFRIVTADGTEVPAMRDSGGVFAALRLQPLQALTLHRCEAKDIPQSKRETAGELVLENECIRCEFAPDGTLNSLFDKRLKCEMLKPEGGNLLRLYVDAPRIYEGAEVELTDLDVPPESPVVLGAPEIERGALRSMLHFHLKIGNSLIEQTAVLENGSSCIDFETKVEWAEFRRRLRVEFSVENDAEEAVCETSHGFLRRPLHCNTAYEMARYEFPAQRYVDISDDRGGVALLNNGRYGYSATRGRLALSLLRAPEVEDTSHDNGTHIFTYSLYSHTGDFDASQVIGEAEALNREPLLLEGVAEIPALPFTLSGDGVRLEAFKRAERSDDLIVRLVEKFGKHVTISLGVPGMEMRVCDPLEWELGEVTDGTLAFRPFEVKTLRLKKAEK